jgi:hypothetical protein
MNNPQIPGCCDWTFRRQNTTFRCLRATSWAHEYIDRRKAGATEDETVKPAVTGLFRDLGMQTGHPESEVLIEFL